MSILEMNMSTQGSSTARRKFKRGLNPESKSPARPGWSFKRQISIERLSISNLSVRHETWTPACYDGRDRVVKAGSCKLLTRDHIVMSITCSNCCFLFTSRLSTFPWWLSKLKLEGNQSIKCGTPKSQLLLWPTRFNHDDDFQNSSDESISVARFRQYCNQASSSRPELTPELAALRIEPPWRF